MQSISQASVKKGGRNAGSDPLARDPFPPVRYVAGRISAWVSELRSTHME